MARRPKVHASKDPFAPIEVAATVVLALMGTVIAIFLVSAGVEVATKGHTDVTLFSFEDAPCVTADAGPIGIKGSDPDPVNGEVFPPTSSRGLTSPSSYQVCLQHATVGERVAASMEGLLSFGMAVGSALLVRRAIRRARRRGLFTPESAAATRGIGWFLVVMSVALPVGSQIGTGIVVAAAVPDQHWWMEVADGFLPVSFTLLLIGLGVLSFARILRVAVPLQEEAELTV